MHRFTDPPSHRLPPSCLATCWHGAPHGPPIQRTLPPEVHQGGEQHADEDHHFDVTDPAELTEGDGPSDEEHRFEVEDHEKHRDQVKLDGQAHACGTGGDDP